MSATDGGIGFFEVKVYIYLSERTSQCARMNKYFAGIILCGFPYEVPLLYSRHHRCLEHTDNTASDRSVVEPNALQMALGCEVFVAVVAGSNKVK